MSNIEKFGEQPLGQSQQFQENKEREKKIIIEEPFGSKISDEEIKERRKIVEDVEMSQRNRNEYRNNIGAIKEKIENGELITNIEAGLLRAEETENVEEEMVNLLTPENNETKQEEAKEPRKETFISEKITNEALKNFNLKEGELKNLEGFGDLSEGQQKIILQNLKQISLVRVQAEAAERASEDNKNRGFLGKLLQSAIGSDKLKIARLEREKAMQLEKGGVAVHGESLRQLIKGMKEFGPKAENKEGASYISEKEFVSLNIMQKEVFRKYNDIAAQYSQLPEEYGFETANKKDKAKYDEMTGKYKQAQESILPVLKELYGGEKESMLRLNKADFGVKMNQFITSHPDVEKRLEGIKNSSWLKVLGKSFGEKGLYGGAGFAMRSAAVGSLGFIGAPIAAVGMGAWLSYRNAKKEIIKNETLSRKGFKDKSKTAKNFVKADTLITNIDRLIRKINEKNNSGGDEVELNELKKSLALRVKYTTDKMDKGLVDFGATEAQISKTAEERKESESRGVLGNRYFLINKLSEAIVIGDDKMIEQGEMKQRLDKFLKLQEDRISSAELKYLGKQTLKGAGIAAGFAAGGYLIRNFLPDEWFKWNRSGHPKGNMGVKSNYLTDDFGKVAPEKQSEILKNLYKPKDIVSSTEFKEVGYNYKPSSSHSFPEFVEGGGFQSAGGGAPEFREVIAGAEKSLVGKGETIANLFNKGNIVENLRKIGLKFNDSDYVSKGEISKIKDFGEKGFSLIFKEAKDGSMKFGVDGPTALGKYNWGADGKSWLFKADADINVENINKAKDFIKKAAASFYNYEEGVKKSGGDGIFS